MKENLDGLTSSDEHDEYCFIAGGGGGMCNCSARLDPEPEGEGPAKPEQISPLEQIHSMAVQARIRGKLLDPDLVLRALGEGSQEGGG